MRRIGYSNLEYPKKKYDEQIQLLFAYLKELLPKQNEPMRRIGYRMKDEE